MSASLLLLCETPLSGSPPHFCSPLSNPWDSGRREPHCGPPTKAPPRPTVRQRPGEGAQALGGLGRPPPLLTSLRA